MLAHTFVCYSLANLFAGHSGNQAMLTVVIPFLPSLALMANLTNIAASIVVVLTNLCILRPNIP